jgi:hypothetical protein
MPTDHGPGMSGSGRSARRFRTAVVLAAGIAIGVAMTATPVSGHIGNSVTHLWNAHIKPKTDARYYTKSQANARYYTRGQANARFLPAAGTAANAEQLDGLDSTAFLRSSAKAADTELLDGLDSTQFVQGNGQTVAGAQTFAPGGVDNVFRLEGFFSVVYFCPTTLTNNGQLIFNNHSGSVVNVFVESGGANPTYSVVGDRLDLAAAASGDSFHFQVQGSFGVATIEAASVHRTTDCHAQAQAVITS